MKRVASLILALALLLTGAALAEPAFVIKNEYTLPVVDEPVTYTMLSETAYEFEGAGMETLADGKAYQEWFKRTGVSLEIVPAERV